MRKAIKTTALIFAFASLAACSTFTTKKPNPSLSATDNTKTTAEAIQESIAAGDKAVRENPIGGNIANSMDSLDRSKLARGLDKAPGTPTKWVNAVSGTTYSVTPVKKINVSGFQFCRNYTVTATQGGNTREFNGNACIAGNGNWQAVN